MRLINRPCTIIARHQDETEWDDYGDEEVVERRRASVCEVQQRSRIEPRDMGETSVTEWDMFFRAGETLDTGDAVEVGGAVYEVVGDPWIVRNPVTGKVSHVEATARIAGTGGDGS